MGNLFKQFHNFKFLLLIGMFFMPINTNFAEGISQVSESISKDKSLKDIKLKKMPIGDIDTALENVNFQRNPFLIISSQEIPGIENLFSGLEFKGLVKTKMNSYAVISKQEEQKLYKVGDFLTNEFFIKSILIEKESVDISNGIKNYRLSFTNLYSDK